MSQRTFPRGSENRKYRDGYLYNKERYIESLNKRDDTNKEHQKRETLRDLTYKYTGHLTTDNANERKDDHKSFRETTFGKGLLSSYVKVERIDRTDKIENQNYDKSTLDANKFFTELSKGKSVIVQDKFDKQTCSKIDKMIQVENYFKKVYGKNRPSKVEFYDLEFIKNTKLRIPEWILKDNSEKLFEAELPPQDITVHNLWFFRRKIEGSPDFVYKKTMPISNDDISLHLENVYNISREENQNRSGINRIGSRMARQILDGLRKVNNYTLYIGSEIRYPNNVMEKTPRLVEKLEKVLESARTYKNHEEIKHTSNDEKAIMYAKELLDVAWMNFHVRTIDDSKNRVTFMKTWTIVNKEFEEIIEKYFRRNKKI